MGNIGLASVKNFEEHFKDLWLTLQKKVDQMILHMGNKSPHASLNGIYNDARLDWWTSGFWGGILWILYDITGCDKYREAAWSWDEKIEQEFIKDNNFHHDVGFQFLPTAVIKYKLTGNESSKRRGLFAAQFLSGRFNPAGSFLRAWNQDKIGWSIIDSSMNLSLLFWASEEIGDPRFKHIAMLHADTILRHFIREDGSVRHIVVFDAETGEFVRTLGGQGYSPDSSWSRGQAWALYGMANTYRYTGETRYLQAARKVADYFLNALSKDNIPYWDFRADSSTDEPKDTSAASCAASGLIEICRLLPGNEGQVYMDAAKKILDALTQGYFTGDQPEYEGILLGGTENKPVGRNVNVSLIYGDYFYVEAIAKISGWKNHIF